MAKSTTLNTRMDNDLKIAVEKILSEMGLTHSSVINLLYHQIKMYKGLPFQIHIPNKETLETFAATDRGEGLTEYNTLEELIDKSQNW